VVEGKIVESWVEVDMLGVMRQLSAVPEPGQTEEAVANRAFASSAAPPV
jgi:hypothetical protein